MGGGGQKPWVAGWFSFVPPVIWRLGSQPAAKPRTRGLRSCLPLIVSFSEADRPGNTCLCFSVPFPSLIGQGKVAPGFQLLLALRHRGRQKARRCVRQLSAWSQGGFVWSDMAWAGSWERTQGSLLCRPPRAADWLLCPVCPGTALRTAPELSEQEPRLQGLTLSTRAL